MDADLKRHMKRMLNRQNVERIAKFATASTVEEWVCIPPSFLTVDLTWNCNYDCQGCIDTKARDGCDVVRKKQGGNPLDPDPVMCEGPYLQEDIVESIISFVKKNHLHGVQLMGGETLLHPKIDFVLTILAEHKIPVELVTNGSLIIKHLNSLKRVIEVEGSWLRVSINGWDGYGDRIGWPNNGNELRDNVILGIKQLINILPDDKKDRVFVTTVIFQDALNDLEHIVAALATAGIARMAVIRERSEQSKEFISGQEHIRNVTLETIKRIEENKRIPKLKISVADNILVEPAPQDKPYGPCPSIVLKTLIGADGFLYACTDHRGCEYARLVNLGDYSGDLEKAWKATERVTATLKYCPSTHCKSIVCQRYEGNTAISFLRSHHHTWTF